MRVEHRYIKRGWYTPKGATALLIGTFPSVLIREAFGKIRTTDVDFFYGSMDNNLWKDLALVYNRELDHTRTPEAIQQRMQLLDDLGLALSDAIYSCESKGSAMDTALEHIELNTHLITVLDKTPSIQRIYFTSSSGKINAERLSLRLLKEQGRLSGMKIVQPRGPRMRRFIYLDAKGSTREIDTLTLYSPSPLAEQWGITPEKRRAQYKQWLPALTGR
jgi:G:T/U-mismatch repair DNA glycosylase